ncbi:nucleoside-diphosphate kinase [Patescibacteria group bacterium]|nr:nucleoside-diphosphate kinase [Patescibacteria group bacterium]
MSAKYKTHPLPTEKTFVMVKPDGVMRGLIGEVIKRFEQRGLKIIALKMIQATHEQMDAFYPKNPEWISRLGGKALKTFAEYELDPVKELGTDDAAKIGQDVRNALIEFMILGPVVPMVIEGVHAISVVRKLAGATLPVFAEPGTIRGDYSHDAPTAANMENRGIFNIVHASETKEEAAHETAHWFKPSELHDYDRSDHVIMFGDKRNL